MDSKRELTYDQIFKIAEMLKGTDYVLALKSELQQARFDQERMKNKRLEGHVELLESRLMTYAERFANPPVQISNIDYLERYNDLLMQKNGFVRIIGHLFWQKKG